MSALSEWDQPKLSHCRCRVHMDWTRQVGSHMGERVSMCELHGVAPCCPERSQGGAQEVCAHVARR